MEAREILAQRAPSLEERINALRDKGVVIGGTTYRYNFAQISAATGVSRSMISMFANGNIRIKPEQQKMLEDLKMKVIRVNNQVEGGQVALSLLKDEMAKGAKTL